MSSYQSSHIFSQGGDLSQLTGGFPLEMDSGTNEEREDNLQASEAPHTLDTMSSKAEAIFEENRQINRFVELSLKQHEKKRIKLINKQKTLKEKETKLTDTHKRQSEQSVELQMSVEEWSMKYENELRERNKVAEKLKQVKNFINGYEHNLAKGVAVGKSIEGRKQLFQNEFENIRNKYKLTQENVTKMQASVTTGFKEMANKCKHLRDVLMENREKLIGEIQTLATQNDEKIIRINSIQEEIAKAEQNKENLTQSHNSILTDHKALNESIAKIYQELNEIKTVNASRIQHLKLQINTEENKKCNLETKLKEKDESMCNLATKLKELLNLSNQIRDAVDGAEKHVEKKVKEIDLYRNKKPVLKDQVCSLVETLKKYENVENENKHYKDSISSLEDEVKLNIAILSKKENILLDLTNEMNGLEENLNVLKGSKFDLDKKLQNLQTIEHKLSCTMEDDKISYQQEREKKLEQNETLLNRNSELAAEIAECALKLEELCKFNEYAKEKEEEMKGLIESYAEKLRINEDMVLKDEEEQVKLIEKYNEKINEMTNYLDRNDCFIQEAKPKKEELALALEKKEFLEQEIKLLAENHHNKINTLQKNHRAKIQEMDSEMEKHSSIMKNIQSSQEESTNKFRAEIKEEEKIKTKLENELRALHQKLKGLKNEELKKRNKIAKLEKHQQKIINEMKVTREDIAQAVTGKSQDSQPTPKRARIMTPASSASSSNSLHGKKTVNENRPTSILGTRDSKEEITRKWIESVPEDDYDFSEV